MKELMNEHEQKLFENLMVHNSAYYGYELSKGEIKTILQAFTDLKKYRATTEAEIRAKAIDEFFDELQKYEKDDWLKLKMLSIYHIAEQLKEE